jgi:hypothetical protein
MSLIVRLIKTTLCKLERKLAGLSRERLTTTTRRILYLKGELYSENSKSFMESGIFCIVELEATL